MGILEMSFYGTLIIAVILLLRFGALNRLPKRLFLLLWELALVRLLLPFSITSRWNVFSLAENLKNLIVGKTSVAETMNGLLEGQLPVLQNIQGTEAAEIGNVVTETLLGTPFPLYILLSFVWLVGMLACLAYFVVAYLRCYREFRTSLPVENTFVREWMVVHSLKRRLVVRQSDRISSSLTYGIFRPVILLSEKVEWENEEKLSYILLHEYVHVRRFDMVRKLFMVAVLCLHWFNPFVWVMFQFFNRDIELFCDEQVLRLAEGASKKNYARLLLSMAEERAGLTPLYNHFSKNVVEERITAIAKGKKATLWTVLLSILLVLAVLILFATSKGEWGLENPDSVLSWAEAFGASRFEKEKELGGYVDWRLEEVRQVYAYEDFLEKELLIYQANYEFLVENPEEVTLAGGMRMDEEGWLVPGYPNAEYLIFEKVGEELIYLGVLYENDCYPGDEVFDADLESLLLGLEGV